MAEKTDYSPVVEEGGEAEKRRERRKWRALLAGAHVFWIYAAILAGIILLVIYLTGGFGVGSS
jgi:cell division septal protein FtsQ